MGERMPNEAEHLKQEAQDKGQAMIEDQPPAIVDRVGDMAKALRSTSDQLKTQDQRAMAQFTQQAADGIEQFSQALKNRDVDTLVGQVEDFARNPPGAFIGSMALLGVIAARLEEFN
jgi:hypothetical protein